MKINESIRKELNNIVQPYTGWHYEFELNQMYDELRQAGVDIDVPISLIGKAAVC